MIPLKDENPSSTVPFVNLFLIAVNICVFVYLNFFSSGETNQYFLQLGFIPYELNHFTDIGPKNLVPLPLTIFTSMFIHGGWIHLLSNLLYLWIFGDNVEDLLGHAKYLLFYLICGMAATGVHFIINPASNVPTVGASGAIAGVLGAYLFLFPKARVKTLLILFIFIKIISIPAIILLVAWIAIQIFSAYIEYGLKTNGGIAWFAHIGGFTAGFVMIILLQKRKKRPYLKKR
jgi:membrane associated rhomboid family serine protease